MFEINAKESFIQINNFKESIEMDLFYWNAENYEKQWCQTCQKILDKEESKWAFITNMYDPKYANFYTIWTIYREKKDIFFRNQLLFPDQLEEEFNLNNLDSYMYKREINDGDIDENGIFQKVSEWQCTLDDIKSFYKQIC